MNRFVGVDIGGTNTDLIFVDLDERTLTTAKVPTTAHNQAEGLITGIDALGVAPSQIDLLVHGTTVATNATIERNGARCGLITTAGFRDVLELRRRDRPHTYGLDGDFRPLVPRHLRREVAERVSAEGEVLLDIDRDALRAQMQALMDAGCEVLVVCFLHAYVNPIHEQVAKEVAREVWHNGYVVLSSEVLPTLREFERTSTTVISGYVQPLIGRYLSRLADELKQAAYHRELLVVQSNGGVMSASMATRFAANTILSGPAAGVTAAMSIASDLNMANVVSCDMGGTSLDICVIRDGVATLTQNSMVDFGIPLSLPMLDVDAIGAGGGSIARIDGAGILQVGPQSAGAYPGPACYGRGGTRATVTDASVVVGLLRPDSAIGKQRGSGMAPELSRAVIQETIADPLRLDVEQAAEAILTLTGAKMAGHVQRKLLEQGLDPRSFSVIAFGGAGPVHANRILREAGLARAIIPYFPGITSALGCILGQLRHDFLRTVNRSLGQLDDAQLGEIYSAQSEEGRAIVREEGHLDGDEEIRYSADMCYRGQSNVIPVPLGSNALPGMGQIRQAFEASYLELYGRLLDADTEIMLVNARTVVSVAPKVASIRDLIRLPDGPVAEPEYVKVYFDGSWHATAQYDRLELPAGAVIKGPALLMQPDTTCFVEPGYTASVHESGNIFIEAE